MDDQLAHGLTIEPALPISVNEVTQADYSRITRTTGGALLNDANWERGGRPAINVSWNDAVAYAAWLFAQAGKNLPTPTGGQMGACNPRRYDDGLSLCRLVRAGASQMRRLRQRLGKPEQCAGNARGQRDMHGNLRERVQDCSAAGYEDAPTDANARNRRLRRARPAGRFLERYDGAPGFSQPVFGERRP